MTWLWWGLIAFCGLLAFDILIVVMLYWANRKREWMPDIPEGLE